MDDIITNTLDEHSKPENRLRAVQIYCEGVRQDFPETAIWMNNILTLAGFPPELPKK